MLEEAIELNTILTDEDLERLTVIINIHASPYRRDMEFPGLLRLACKATLDKLTQEMERGRYRAEDIAQYQSMQTEILQFLKTRES